MPLLDDILAVLAGAAQGGSQYLLLREQQRRDDEERKRRDEEREFDRATRLTDLHSRGYRRESDLPAFTLPEARLRVTPDSPGPIKPQAPQTFGTGSGPIATTLPYDPVRYEHVGGGFAFDRQENPEARERRRTQDARQQLYASYIAAGMAPNRAAAAAVNPTLADDFFRIREPGRVSYEIRDTETGFVGIHPGTLETKPVTMAGVQLRGRQPRPPRDPAERRNPDLVTIEKQVDDAQSAVTRAERRLSDAENALDPQPARIEIARRALSQAQAKLDSLSAKRDTLAGRDMGTLPATSRGLVPAGESASRGPRSEYARAAAAYRQAIRDGMNEAEARALYDRVVASIARRYGQLQ